MWRMNKLYAVLLALALTPQLIKIQVVNGAPVASLR